MKRYPSITSHCLHSGVVSTEIAGKNDNRSLWKYLWKIFSPLLISPAKGARTSVYLASAPETLQVNGLYFDKRKQKESSEISYDAALAGQLWEVSEQLVKS